MQFISVGSSPRLPVRADERAAEAIGGVIACIGAPDFGHTALAQLNRWLPVSWWSVFRLHDDGAPAMPTAGSFGVPDGTGDSWSEYRSNLYRQDQTFAAAREQLVPARLALVHWHAREIPQAHRERIYTRHGLRERLSIVCRDTAGALLAVNLYRHQALPRFTDGEIDLVGSAAGLLLSCVQRHLQLAPPGPAADMGALAGLTRREREVCERMLKGWTHDGIAADLGISPGTVKTYRDRAFVRLGIHHRNELFPLVFGYRAN